MKYAALVAFVIACAAQLSSPLIGFVRTNANELRPVYGVAGAFVLGDPVERDVLSAAFTSVSGLVKKEAEVLVFSRARLVGRPAAPAGPAQFGFTPAGEPAWIRFESSCHRFVKGELQAADADTCPAATEWERVGDEWFAVRENNRILLKRGETTWEFSE